MDVDQRATKYLAWGWWQMIAEVVCSGLVLPAGLLADLDAEPVGAEQRGDGGVVLEVGARRVAPRVAAAAVLLAEQPADRRAVLADEPPLLADPLVPVLGERLGHLDAEAVQQQVLLVLVGGEQPGRLLADRRAHRDDVEGGVVDLAGLDRPEEVGDAQERRRPAGAGSGSGPPRSVRDSSVHTTRSSPSPLAGK